MQEDYEEIGNIDIEEEENYFIALTDLMTGVVFIFVILLVTYAMTFHSAQKQLEQETSKAADLSTAAMRAEEQAKQFKTKAEQTTSLLDRQLADSRQKAEEIDSLARALKEREEYRKKLLEEVVSRLNKQGIRVSLDPDNGIIRLPEELLFDSGQAVVRPEAAAALDILASELNQLLKTWCDKDARFGLESLFIEGHTDSRPIKTDKFSDNWELSTSRAVNISRALTASQPMLGNYKNPRGLAVIGVSGYGEFRPVADNATDDGRRKNRRIDLRFLIAYPSGEEIIKATKSFLKNSSKQGN